MSAVLGAQEPGARYLAAAQPGLVRQFDLVAGAPGGVARLRELILTLAVRGRLVPQDPSDEPAAMLVERVRVQREGLVASGAIRREKPVPAIGEDEPPYLVPESWEWVRLSNLYYSISPSDRKLPSSAVSEAGQHPVVDQGQSFVAGYTDDDALLIRIPGPVIVFGDHTKNIKFIDFDFVAGADGTKILRPILVNERFFALQLRSYNLTDRGYARHFRVLNSQLFTLPPLAEQARIVARVDELMRLCDALETQGRLEAAQHARLLGALLGTLTDSTTPEELSANWQRVAAHFDLLLDRPEAMDALERTILQLAVRGLLVAQEPSDEPASALLERLDARKRRTQKKPLPGMAELDTVVAPYELPRLWTWAQLGDLVENMGSGWSPACEDGERNDPARWAVLRTTAVQVMEYRAREHKAIPLKFAPRPEIEVQRGDILVTRAGPMNRVGISCWVDQTPSRLMLSDKIVRFHPASDELSPAFLVMAMNAGWTRELLEAAKTGMAASQVNVSQSDLKSLWVPVCSREEQARIVARVADLRRLCADLRQRLTASQTTQSHLAEALVEQAAA